MSGATGLRFVAWLQMRCVRAAAASTILCVVFFSRVEGLAGSALHGREQAAVRKEAPAMGVTDKAEGGSLGSTPASIFEPGPFPVQLLSIQEQRSGREGSGTSLLPPKPLLTAFPTQEGEYPVVLFQHGFMLRNVFYSQLLQFVASHGYIVLAPQMYTFAGPDATGEIAGSAALIDWLPLGLGPALPPDLQVRPDLRPGVAIAGHSRGGKVAYGVALGLSRPSIPIAALVALDPVDGLGDGQQTKPAIIKPDKNSLLLPCPALVVGSGLGPLPANRFFPPCAPAAVGPRAFFNASSAPSFLLIAPKYGHMDFLDDDTKGIRGHLSRCTCKNGPAREPMRRASSGAFVAFLRYALTGNDKAWNDLLENPRQAPVELEAPQWHIEAPSDNVHHVQTKDKTSKEELAGVKK